MLLPTHLAAGQAAYLAACLATGHAPDPREAMVAIIAAALPDLDCRAGLVGRMVPPLSEWIERRFGHRTFTHSLLLQLAAGVALYYLLPHGYFLAFMAGWLSHTFTDMMTPAGVGWFWPSRVRCVLPGNNRYRMAPMGWGEFFFLVMLGAASVGFYHLAASTAGTTGVIASAIGEPAEARDQYDAMKGGNTWTLKIEGRDNASFRAVDGKYRIIGGYKESGFILETEDGAVSACKSSSCDWHISRAVLVRGEKRRTESQTVRVGAIDAGTLFSYLEPWIDIGQVYLSGTLDAAGIEERLPTVELSGTESVKLRYAPAEWLRELGKVRLRNLDLTIQVRTEPGMEPPELVIEGSAEGCLSPLLEKWLTQSDKRCL